MLTFRLVEIGHHWDECVFCPTPGCFDVLLAFRFGVVGANDGLSEPWAAGL